MFAPEVETVPRAAQLVPSVPAPILSEVETETVREEMAVAPAEPTSSSLGLETETAQDDVESSFGSTALSRDTSNRESFSSCYSAALATPSEAGSMSAPAPNVVSLSDTLKEVDQLLETEVLVVSRTTGVHKKPSDHASNDVQVEVVSQQNGFERKSSLSGVSTL